MMFQFRGQGDELQVKTPLKGRPGGEERSWRPLVDLGPLPQGLGPQLLIELGLFWPFMPLQSPFLRNLRPSLLHRRRLPTLLAKIPWRSLPDHLIFFGGSFNPWHNGHRSCIELCLKEMEMEMGIKTTAHIIVVPDCNPWKKEPLFACPWAQFKAICQEVEDLPCSVYPSFWGMGRKNPTAGWLPKVKAKKKGLLIGADSFIDLPRWENAPQVLQNLSHLYVVPRQESPAVLSVQVMALKSQFPRLKITLLDKGPYQDLSSSHLLKKLKQNPPRQNGLGVEVEKNALS